MFDIFFDMLSHLVYTIWTDWARLAPPVARLGAVGLGGGRRTPFSIYVFPIYYHYPSYRCWLGCNILDYFVICWNNLYDYPSDY